MSQWRRAASSGAHSVMMRVCVDSWKAFGIAHPGSSLAMPVTLANGVASLGGACGDAPGVASVGGRRYISKRPRRSTNQRRRQSEGAPISPSASSFKKPCKMGSSGAMRDMSAGNSVEDTCARSPEGSTMSPIAARGPAVELLATLPRARRPCLVLLLVVLLFE